MISWPKHGGGGGGANDLSLAAPSAASGALPEAAPASDGHPASDIPLPQGWDVGKDFDGKVYFIDHINKKTTWVDPRER